MIKAIAITIIAGNKRTFITLYITYKITRTTTTPIIVATGFIKIPFSECMIKINFGGFYSKSLKLKYIFQ